MNIPVEACDPWYIWSVERLSNKTETTRKINTLWECYYRRIIETGDLWDTDFISDNWEQQSRLALFLFSFVCLLCTEKFRPVLFSFVCLLCWLLLCTEQLRPVLVLLSFVCLLCWLLLCTAISLMDQASLAGSRGSSDGRIENKEDNSESFRPGTYFGGNWNLKTFLAQNPSGLCLDNEHCLLDILYLENIDKNIDVHVLSKT